MFKTRRTISMNHDKQSVRVLMAGTFKLTNEDWVQSKEKTTKTKINKASNEM